MSDPRAGGRGRSRALLISALAVLLAATGCGARWSDNERASVLARYQAASGAAAPGSGGPAAGTATPGAAGPSAAGSTNTGSAGATGASTSGAGAGGTAAAAASSLPCAAHSDAPGVTDTTISIGTANSLSGPVPGLGSSHLAATQAYVAYRNAHGGVCGRQVVLKSGDDGTDTARNRSIFNDLDSQVVAFVGGIAGGGDGGAQIVNERHIPVVGMSIAPELDKAATFYGINAALASYDAVIGKYRYLYDQGVRKAAVVYISAATSPQEAKRQMSLMRAAGIDVVNEQALPLSTLSYDSAARAVANSGADYLLFFHADGPSASMAQAMADTGYQLKFEEFIVAYGSNFAKLAGAAAEGASTWLYALPAEDGGVVPEHAAFLESMGDSAPDASVDTFAAQGWAGTKLLLDTIEAEPGPIARDGILGQLAATGKYDAAGMIGPVEIGAKTSDGCVIGMIYQGGAWRRMTPATGFLC